ncbi:hypothetical protein [Streptomyces sp. NPDC059142]|uniref:hypothetical protein n=1 Tax=Streptomyces sp. NPDC059142 TaxID=3346739 RepID=UPI003683E155
MAVRQLPVEIGTFARYLTDLTALLDPGAGWYGVFLHRDPDGLRACLDGSEIPPWDVVESLLQDFAAGRDPGTVAGEGERAGRLYSAAAGAYDRLPGGGEALTERLRLMDRERTHAAGRAEELVRLLRTTPEGAPGARQLGHDLAWIRDDLARATARCSELGARLATLPGPDAAAPAAPHPAPARGRTLWSGRRRTGEPAPAPAAGPTPEPPQKKRRPRGARFAGIEVDEVDEVQETEEPPPAPEPPAPPPAAPATPRGARFGGAPVAPPREAPPAPSPEDQRAAVETVTALRGLRADGRTGEAHVVLCEAAGRPPEQLPLLAAELHRAGLGADWAELLWEAAFLPPERLAAAARALAVAGRDDDCAQLLRQGVSRPAGEITDAVLALDESGRAHEARALLSAFVQARAPEDAALLAAPDPHRLVPRLLAAARAVSASRERDVVHALRVAGIATS